MGNTSKKSIPVYLETPLHMTWGRGQTWGHSAGTGLTAMVSRPGRSGLQENGPEKNGNATASNNAYSPERNKQP